MTAILPCEDRSMLKRERERVCLMLIIRWLHRLRWSVRCLADFSRFQLLSSLASRSLSSFDDCCSHIASASPSSSSSSFFHPPNGLCIFLVVVRGWRSGPGSSDPVPGASSVQPVVRAQGVVAALRRHILHVRHRLGPASRSHSRARTRAGPLDHSGQGWREHVERHQDHGAVRTTRQAGNDSASAARGAECNK